MAKTVKRFARGGDAGGDSGGEGDGGFSFGSGDYDYDYDYGADQGADDTYYQDGSGSEEGSDGLGWRQNGDGTWSYTEADGTVRNFDANENEIFVDQEVDNTDDLGGESGWRDNGDGTWTYTDADGDVRQFGSDGVEIDENVVGEDPTVVVGKKDADTREINGITYTRNADGKWMDDEGSIYTDDEIDSETENPTNPDDWGAEHVRNPDGSTTTTRTDGVIITKMPDGTTITQNGPGGSVHTTTPDGKTTQTTPAGTNPNTGLPSLLKPDEVVKPGDTTKKPGDKKIPDWLLGALGGGGLAALLASGNKDKGPDNSYKGAGIDMGLQFNRSKLPQDPNRRPGSGGAFLGAGSFGPKTGGIADIPNPATQQPGTSIIVKNPDGTVTENGQPAHGYFGGHPVSKPDDGIATLQSYKHMPDGTMKDLSQPYGPSADGQSWEYDKRPEDANLASWITGNSSNTQELRDQLPAFNDARRRAGMIEGTPEYESRSKWLDDTSQWGAELKAAQAKQDAQRIENGWGPQSQGIGVVNGPPAATAATAPAAPAASATPQMVGSFVNENGETVDYDASGKHYARTKKMAEGGIAQAFAKGGPTKPRYLRGETDGMADQIKARIDGGQEARLAHGEFVIPADVVSHLGNGNSDAGAKKLYSMMDKIRVARTGNKKQGKQINPDKFLPGGSQRKMASGGITDVIPRFAEGGTTTGVNNWAGGYATDLLSQGNAIGNDMISNPGNYVYQGPRTAATNDLQTQAMNFAGSMPLVNPNAAAAGDLQFSLVNQLANQPAYQAANVGSGYSAGPAYQAANVGSGYATGPAYQASNVSSGYSVGPAYDTTKFQTKDFDQDAAKRYMNPYLKESLDPQLAEARRQAEITRMTNAGRLVGSGAFGGGRQAVMEAEGDRNLGTNLAGITGRGYDTAYTNAMGQFNADTGRRLQADQASEQSKQFGHSSGMTDRSNAANFGLQAAGINETSRQFGHKSAMDDRSNAANYGLQAAGINERSREYGHKSAMDDRSNTANYGLQAAGINERSRESGARMGLDALTGAMSGASSYGSFLNSQDANTRANLNTLTSIGNDKFNRDQAGVTADMNQFNEEAALPGQAINFKKNLLSGMPISNTTTTTADPSTLQQLMGLGLTAAQIASLFGED